MSKIRVKCDCDAGDECPQGRCGSMRRCSILRDERIEATIVDPPTSPKPTFELGKSYRAVNNAVMKIIGMHSDGGFVARVIEGGKGDGACTVVYDIRGVTIQSGWSDYNLFYGAVEDTTFNPIPSIERRLDDIGKQFGTMAESIEAQRLVADGAHIRCDVLRDDMVRNLETTDLGICGLSDRVDNLEKHCEAWQGNLTQLQISMVENFQLTDNRLDALQRSRELLTRLIDYMGLDVGDYGKVQPKRQEASIKRIFKGGWVNVYLDAAGPWFNPRPWSSREEAAKQADPRERQIACIQIPNITEGEGL